MFDASGLFDCTPYFSPRLGVRWSADWETAANKEPAHALALHALVIAGVTCRFARWAFGPIFLADCALIHSHASVREGHSPAFPIGQDNVMAGRSTACANCDWFRALHAVVYYILPPQPPLRQALILCLAKTPYGFKIN